MQQEKKVTDFKVGDRVRAVSSDYLCDGLLKGEEGIVTKFFNHLIYVVHTRNDVDWPMSPTELEKVAPKARRAPSAAADLRITPQAKTILAHLKSGKTISPMQASVVYDISRLASCIHEIRSKAGYKVRTDVRMDESGHKYGRYVLVTTEH